MLHTGPLISFLTLSTWRFKPLISDVVTRLYLCVCVCVCVRATDLLAGGQTALVSSELLPQQRSSSPGQALQNLVFHLDEMSPHRLRQAHIVAQHQLDDLLDHRKTRWAEQESFTLGVTFSKNTVRFSIDRDAQFTYFLAWRLSHRYYYYFMSVLTRAPQYEENMQYVIHDKYKNA